MDSEHCGGLRVSMWRTGYIMARNFPPVWITVTYMTRVPLFSFGGSWNGSLPLWVAPWKPEELRCPLLLPSLWRVWQLSVLVRVSAQLRWTALDSQHELATQQTVCRPVKKGWKLKTQLSSWTIKDRFQTFTISSLLVSERARGSSSKLLKFYFMKFSKFLVYFLSARWGIGLDILWKQGKILRKDITFNSTEILWCEFQKPLIFFCSMLCFKKKETVFAGICNWHLKVGN